MSTSKGAGKAPQLMYVVAVSLMSTEPFAQVNDVVLHHTLRLMVLLRRALAAHRGVCACSASERGAASQ